MVNCFYDDERAKKASLSSHENWPVRASFSVPIPEEIPRPIPISPSVSSQSPLDVPQLLRERYNIRPRKHILICTDENNDVRCDLSPSLLSKKQNASDHVSLKALVDAIGKVGKHLNTILHDNRPSPENGELVPYDAQLTNAPARDLNNKSCAPLATSSVLLNPDIRETPSGTITPNGTVTRSSTVASSDTIIAAHGEEGSTEEEPDEDFTGMNSVEKQIQIGDTYLIDGFYETRFRQMQQLSCKTIAKAWIKTVESKKQVRHPYNGGKVAKERGAERGTGGELTKPDWWPRFGCRHREPDHVKRDERIFLLKHILGLANRARTNDSEEITIEKLRRSTNEVSTSLGPKIMAWLDEVYYVRKQEVRYQRHEIDAITPINVIMPDPKSKRRPTKKTETVRTQQAKRRHAERRTHIKRFQRRRTIKGAVVTSSARMSPGLDVSSDSSQCYKQELSPDFGKDVPKFDQRTAQPNYSPMEDDYTSKYPFICQYQNGFSSLVGNTSIQPTAYQSFNSSPDALSSPLNTGPPFHDTTWGSLAIAPPPQPEEEWPVNPPTQPNFQGTSFARPFRPHHNGFASNPEKTQSVAPSAGTIFDSVPNPFHANYLVPLRSKSMRLTNHSLTGAFDFTGPPGYHL